MSSIEVQQEALNNYNDYIRMLYKIHLNDGWIPRSIQHLAQLGTWGGNPGNINRELKHWLGEPTFPKPMMITVPLLTPKPKTGTAMTKDVQFPILLPHEIISHVYHNHPTLFSSLYIGKTMGKIHQQQQQQQQPPHWMTSGPLWRPGKTQGYWTIP